MPGTPPGREVARRRVHAEAVQVVDLGTSSTDHTAVCVSLPLACDGRRRLAALLLARLLLFFFSFLLPFFFLPHFHRKIPPREPLSPLLGKKLITTMQSTTQRAKMMQTTPTPASAMTTSAPSGHSSRVSRLPAPAPPQFVSSSSPENLIVVLSESVIHKRPNAERPQLPVGSDPLAADIAAVREAAG